MVKVTWSHAWRMHAIWNPKPCQESQYISFFCKIWIWNCIQTPFTGEQQPSINDTTLLTDDVDKEQVDAFDDISKHERKSQESDVGEDEKATDVSANSSSSVSSANKVSKDDTFWKFHKRGGHLYSFHLPGKPSTFQEYFNCFFLDLSNFVAVRGSIHSSSAIALNYMDTSIRAFLVVTFPPKSVWRWHVS